MAPLALLWLRLCFGPPLGNFLRTSLPYTDRILKLNLDLLLQKHHRAAKTLASSNAKNLRNYQTKTVVPAVRSQFLTTRKKYCDP